MYLIRHLHQTWLFNPWHSPPLPHSTKCSIEWYSTITTTQLNSCSTINVVLNIALDIALYPNKVVSTLVIIPIVLSVPNCFPGCSSHEQCLFQFHPSIVACPLSQGAPPLWYHLPCIFIPCYLCLKCRSYHKLSSNYTCTWKTEW